MKHATALILCVVFLNPYHSVAAAPRISSDDIPPKAAMLFGLGFLAASAWTSVRTARTEMVTERGSTSFPAAGEMVEARPGEAIAASFNYDEVKVIRTAPGYRLSGNMSQGRESVTAYLMLNDRYCLPTGEACWVDKDEDGDLDKVGYPLGSREAEDVPYEASIQWLDASDQGFRSELVYLGAAGGVLRLAYREFVDDMVRPAFALELRYDLATSGATTIAYQDQIFEIVSAGNIGIQYRLLEASN